MAPLSLSVYNLYPNTINLDVQSLKGNTCSLTEIRLLKKFYNINGAYTKDRNYRL